MARGLTDRVGLTASAGIVMIFSCVLSFSPSRIAGPVARTLSKGIFNGAARIGDFGGQGSRAQRWSRAGSSFGHEERAWRHTSGAPSMVSVGDLATINYSLRTEDGEPFASLFDQGRVRLIVGGGGFAPFVHKAVLGMEPGAEKVINVPPQEAFGEHDPEMTATLGIESAPADLKVGMLLQLWNGLKATVTDVTEKDLKVDWNPVGAGTSLVMDLKLLHAVNAESVLKKATFAGGCFWGLELAFQRAKGVISTKVGYAQGSVKNPSYSQVCSGKTGHTEAVQVFYDPSETTYETLLEIFFERHDPMQANGQGNDKGPQYRAGVYYDDEEQREVAEAVFAKEQEKRGLRKVVTELEEAAAFYEAEDEHQQYLQKGGQDARKAAAEPIRCYG